MYDDPSPYGFSTEMAEIISAEAKKCGDKLPTYLGCAIDDRWTKEALLDLVRVITDRHATQMKELLGADF